MIPAHSLISGALTLAIMGGCMTKNDDVFFVLARSKPNHIQTSLPDSFYVKGSIHEGRFSPKSGVLGEGGFEAEGQRGWLELSSGQFYPTHSGKTPESPFIDGTMTSNGFVPSSREVK